MPFDGFRFSVNKGAGACNLLQHPHLPFPQLIDPDTGEMINSHEKLRKNRITYTPLPSGEVRLSGNLCEYFTQLHNVGTFTYEDCKAALDHFCAYHHLSKSQIKVNQLEIGFNLPTDRSPRDILNNIITFRYKTKEVKTFRGKGLSNAFDLTDYKIQFYDKGEKHKLKESLLRTELIAKPGLLRRKGISTVQDLYDVGKVLSLCDHLQQSIRDTVFTDNEMKLAKLSKKDLNLFQTYRSESKWQEESILSPNSVSKKRKNYQDLIERFGTNNTQKWLLNSIDEALMKYGLVQNSINDGFSAVDKSLKERSLNRPIEVLIEPAEYMN